MIDIAVRFFSRNLTLKTHGASSYDINGNAIADVVSQSPIRGSIQPAKGRDLMDMPEGVRNEASHVLSTTTQVQNDQFIVDGVNEYRIVYVMPSALGHYTRAGLGLIK